MILDLLAARRPALPSPSVLVDALGERNSIVEGGIRWVFPGRGVSADLAPFDPGGGGHVSPARVPATAAKAAKKESERPWTMGPSSVGEKHGVVGGSLSRADALMVGTAVHWMLEHVDDSGVPDLSASRLHEALKLAGEGRRVSAEASDRAGALIQGLQAGTLLGRLQEIDVLGREVPMLLEPGVEGPVAAWVGSIDLLYRCPDSGLVVVADYKTDQVGERSNAEAAHHHADQGRIYVSAVQRALNLKQAPLFEVWLIERDVRVAVDLA